MAADAWEVRTARLEGAYEQIDKRLGALEVRLGSIENRITAMDQQMDAGFAQVRSEMRTQFCWLLGVMIVSGLVQIGLKFPGH